MGKPVAFVASAAVLAVVVEAYYGSRSRNPVVVPCKHRPDSGETVVAEVEQTSDHRYRMYQTPL